MSNVQTLEKPEKKNIVFECSRGTGGEHEDRYENFKKLIGNSEYSKFDNLKKLSGLAQIFSFL